MQQGDITCTAAEVTFLTTLVSSAKEKASKVVAAQTAVILSETAKYDVAFEELAIIITALGVSVVAYNPVLSKSTTITNTFTTTSTTDNNITLISSSFVLNSTLELGRG